MRYFRHSLSLLGMAGLSAGLSLPVHATNGPAVTGIVASADDATTSASNPAGLTRLHRPEWVGDVQAFFSESSWKTTASSIDGSTTDDGSGSLFIPAIYYAHPVDDDLTLGISLTVPSGLGSDPGNDTKGRYLLQEWSLGYISLAPAAGYRINEQWSVGAAINLNYSAYNYEAAVFNGLDEPDGKMKLKDGDFGTGFQLGLLYESSPRTRFGLTYRSSSTAKFSDAPELSGLTPEREQILEDAGIRGQNISMKSRFPQAIAAGFWHQFENGRSVTLDVAWVEFSQFGLTSATVGESSIEVKDDHFDDIWASSAGMSWPVDDQWTMRFGMAYVSSGVDSQNRGYALRLDRIIGAGIGAEYRWRTDRIVGFNLTYYDLGDAPITNDVPLVGTVSGEYSSNYAIGLDLSLRWLR
jgi:long-chain fatty acid transport protein